MSKAGEILSLFNESVEGVVDSLMSGEVAKGGGLGELISAADTAITVAAKQNNKKMIEFNRLSKKMFIAARNGDREAAIKAGEALVKAGHGKAFGL